jgi:hypothetical protein
VENPIGTEIYTIGSKTKNILLIENSCSRIEIRNLEQTIEILDSRSLCESAKIVELVTIGQIPNLKYLIVDSFVVESVINVVNGKLVDESRTCLFTSIGTFCLFVEIVSNEKQHKKRVSEPMSHFGNNAFLESNKKVQCVTQIGI